MGDEANFGEKPRLMECSPDILKNVSIHGCDAYMADTDKKSHKKLWQVLKRFVATCYKAYQRYGRAGSPLMAGAIAFYSIVCLGPLGILLSAVLQALYGEGTYQWIENTVEQFDAIAAEQALMQVKGLLETPDLLITGPVSIIALIWAGLRLFETVERSLTQIWPGTVLRNVVGRKLVSLLMMGVSGVLLTLFVLANAFFARLHGLLTMIAGEFPPGEFDVQLIMDAQPAIMGVLGFLLALLAFSLLYKYMPVKRVPKRAAFAGAVCATVLWVAASQIFTYFLRSPSANNAMYGGLAGVVVFSMWAFLGAQVMLFGAHFAAAWQDIFMGQEHGEQASSENDAATD